MTDTLEMNGGTCHKSDLTFLVACRATRPAVDALLRSERDFVPLGYEAARDKLMPHLSNHVVVLQEYREPIAQKDILPTLFEAARRHLVSQVCLGGTAWIQSYMGSWSVAWVRAQPSAAFDTGLSDDAFVDAISIRLGLPAFSAEQACARCPQMLDIYAHHAVTCPMEGRKVRLHNQIRDAFFHCLLNVALGARFESEGILPTEQGRRPADVLFVPTPLCRQSQWALYPHIALDFAVVSPFKVGEF